MTVSSTAHRAQAHAHAPAHAWALGLALGAWALCAPTALALPAAPQEDAPAIAAEADAAVVAARGFEHVLPAEMQGFFGIADLDQFGEELSRQPWGRLWADPACSALRTEVERRLKEALGSASEQLEVDLAEILDELQGGFAIAFMLEGPEDGAPLSDDLHDLRLSLLLVSGVADDHHALEQAVERLLAKACEGESELVQRTGELGRWDVSEVHGEDEQGRVLDLRAVFTDDTLVLELALGGRTFTEAVIDELEGTGSADVLADQPRFRSSVAARAGGLQFWLDAQMVCELARKKLESLSASEQEDDQIGAGVLLRSGLLDIQDFAASSGRDAQGSRFDLHVRWPSDGWLHQVLERLFVPGAFDTLADTQADAVSLSVMRIDFAGLFDVGLKELLATGAVEMSQVVDTLSGFEEATGFALRDDLLESLDGQLAFVTCEVEPTEALPGGASGAEPYNFVLSLGLKDGAAFTTLLEDLVRSRGLHAARKRTEFQGFELFNVPVFPGFAVNYAVLPDKFVASLSPTLVQEVLRRSAGADLPRYAERKDLGALLDRLSPGLGLLSTAEAAQNAYSSVVATIGALTTMAAMQGANPLSDLFVDLPLPELAVFEKHFKGLIAGAVTVDEAGVRMESVGP